LLVPRATAIFSVVTGAETEATPTSKYPKSKTVRTNRLFKRTLQ